MLPSVTTRNNARLFDRLRRRVPEPWRLWIYERIKNNMRARRLLHGWLINRREEIFIQDVIAKAPSGSWNNFGQDLHTIGYTERVVEIPWMLSRYNGERSVLDVGTSFALPVYVRLLKRLGIPDLRAVDIAPADHLGLALTIADIRSMPFANGEFDLIYCISTLEHIGRDESADAITDGDLLALREMQRVLRPGGRLLVSVPFGRPEIHPWFRQYDPRGWAELVQASGLRAVELAYYRYSSVDGWWQAGTPMELEHVSYQKAGATAASGLLCASLVHESRSEFAASAKDQAAVVPA